MNYKLTKSLGIKGIWILSFCCAFILIIFAYFMYPVPDGDSFFFIPTIKSYALYGRLQNKLTNLSYMTDPSGLGRALFHTAGTPLFFGTLLSILGEKSYQNTLTIISLARALSILIFAKSIIILLKGSSRSLSLYSLLIIFILVLNISFFLFASNGRPEILSVLLVSVAMLASLSINCSARRHLVIAVCLALLFPVSIVNGIIGTFMYCLYLAFDVRDLQRILFFLIISVFCSILFLYASYALVGVSFKDGLNGLAIHSYSAVLNFKIALTFKQTLFFKIIWFPFAFLSFLSIIKNFTVFWAAESNGILKRLFLVSCFSSLIFVVYYFGWRNSVQNYNIYPFLPIFQLLSFQLVNEHSSQIFMVPRLLSGSIIFLAATISLLQPLQVTLLFPYYLFSGSNYIDMRNKFEKMNYIKCSLVYTNGIAMLDESQSGSQYLIDDSSAIIPTERIKYEGKTNNCLVAFVQEVNNNNRPPVGTKLVADFSDVSPYTKFLRSWKILNSPKGYSFKVYMQESSEQSSLERR